MGFWSELGNLFTGKKVDYDTLAGTGPIQSSAELAEKLKKPAEAVSKHSKVAGFATGMLMAPVTAAADGGNFALRASGQAMGNPAHEKGAKVRKSDLWEQPLNLAMVVDPVGVPKMGVKVAKAGAKGAGKMGVKAVKAIAG